MISIQGKGASTGVAIGPLYFYQRAKSTITRYEVEDVYEEWGRFKAAQAKAIDQLGELAEKARVEAGDDAALLFETHQMMAEDMDYEESIEEMIKEQKMNAEAAVIDTAAVFADMFAQMDDTYMQARAADVKDVSNRIISAL
ncbi:MAG: phosphoenolpyruvate--protein phosphotransferase, partial [Lachnospiraceae bacterium]|nr:phosphoenolpyruvate--protein phosphotransferase [Lachnospiraceae bacterium]